MLKRIRKAILWFFFSSTHFAVTKQIILVDGENSERRKTNADELSWSMATSIFKYPRRATVIRVAIGIDFHLESSKSVENEINTTLYYFFFLSPLLRARKIVFHAFLTLREHGTSFQVSLWNVDESLEGLKCI